MAKDRLDIRIDKELKDKFLKRAEQEHRSTTQHLTYLIEQDTKKLKNNKK